MFSTIVVGTDGSDIATRAVERAGQLAHQFGAELHVVNGYRPQGTTATRQGRLMVAMPNETSPTRSKEASETLLREACAHQALEGLPVQSHSVEASAPQALVSIADEVHADLIVVGNRGVHGVRGALDPVPNRVAHRAPCAVLIFKTT